MTSLVLDCSVAVSWCFEDEASEKTDLMLDLVGKNGAWVPNIWHLQVANVMLQAVKRNRIKQTDMFKNLNLIEKLPIKTDLETHSRVFKEIAYIADEAKITSYDAAYLELSIRNNVPLITLDKALQKAAKHFEVSLVA